MHGQTQKTWMEGQTQEVQIHRLRLATEEGPVSPGREIVRRGGRIDRGPPGRYIAIHVCNVLFSRGVLR